MLSSEELEFVRTVASNNGYIGYSQGKYFFSNGSKTTSSSTLFKKLALKEAFVAAGQYKLESMFRLGTAEKPILDCLEKVEYKRVGPAQASEEVASQENSQGIIQSIQDNIQIFKTVRRSGVYDPSAKKSNGMAIIAFNNVTRKLINAAEVSIDGLLSIKGWTRDDVIASPGISVVWPDFNPYTPEINFTKYVEELGREHLALNTAIPPKWLKTYPERKGKLDGFIKKLIFHLFPDEVDRELVLDWCHYALFKRNGTVLCLAGDRGTGKSTFVEILSALLGDQYAAVVSEAVLKEKFNSQFHNKRLVIFEEVALDEAQSINKVKAWCNTKITIEEKGSDAFNADNHSSMVFLLNDLSQLKINAQERRFSIPVVAEENLLTAIDSVEVARFKSGLGDGSYGVLEELADFGHFLRERVPKHTEYVPIKGANFDRVADLTMAEWQAHLREYVKSNGEEGVVIPITKIFPVHREEGGMKVPQKRSTIENFLRDYRYKGAKVGDVVDIIPEEGKLLKKNDAPHLAGRTRRTYGIKPRKEFLEVCGVNKIKDEDLL